MADAGKDVERESERNRMRGRSREIRSEPETKGDLAVRASWGWRKGSSMNIHDEEEDVGEARCTVQRAMALLRRRRRWWSTLKRGTANDESNGHALSKSDQKSCLPLLGTESAARFTLR